MAVVAYSQVLNLNLAGREAGNCVYFNCDTQAELPSADVIDGDLAVTYDTKKRWRRVTGAWAETTQNTLAVWGNIIGTLSDQTDLQAALDAAGGVATQLDADGTTLDINAITDGQYLRRVGTTIVSGTPAGGGASATTVEVNLSATATWRGKFTITDATIEATSKVLCWQAPGPYTGKGTRADEAEMQPVSIIAVEPASGSAVVKWQTPPMVVESPLETRAPNFGGGTAANSGTNRDIQTRAKRLGKVRGNVKFSYMVLA